MYHSTPSGHERAHDESRLASNGLGQIHWYALGEYSGAVVDHHRTLGFDQITRFSHGHHVRSGAGNDVFEFVHTSRVEEVIVGRIEDFDPTRDEIWIEGEKINLHRLPSNVRIVEYNGDHNDPGADPQQWLLINTGPGSIFYALHGARVDANMDGGSNEGRQEAHFVNGPLDFTFMKDVRYTNPFNYVPAGFSPDGGEVVQDLPYDRPHPDWGDTELVDVLEPLLGSMSGDLIAGGLNDDHIEALAGNDVVWGGDGHDTARGALGNDTIFGNFGSDKLFGNFGADVLWGNFGNDKLYGGNGVDRLYGGPGADLLIGGGAGDQLFGQSGNDTIHGGAGSDNLHGGHGQDDLFGGSGRDFLSGGYGNDYLHAGSGDDILHGGSGRDRLLGGSGSDLLIAGAGDDVLNGGQGDDVLIGGAGRDVVFGGAGDDRLSGGAGSDTFIFLTGSGHDVLEDFELGVDEIKWQGEVLALRDIHLSGVPTNGDWLIKLADDASISLKGVQLSDGYVDPLLDDWTCLY